MSITTIDPVASDRDPSKRPVVVAIREARARLNQYSLRRLREDLFRHQLALIEEMVERGVDPAFVAGVANTAKTIETIEALQSGMRER